MPDVTPSWRLFQMTQWTDDGSWPGDTVPGGGLFISSKTGPFLKHSIVMSLWSMAHQSWLNITFFRTNDIRVAS